MWRRGKGFLDNVLNIFVEPIVSINEILSLIGIPLLRNTTHTNARAQQTAIAIGDLQVKVSQIEADARKIEQALREEVLIQVLEFDVIREGVSDFSGGGPAGNVAALAAGD